MAALPPMTIYVHTSEQPCPGQAVHDHDHDDQLRHLVDEWGTAGVLHKVLDPHDRATALSVVDAYLRDRSARDLECGPDCAEGHTYRNDDTSGCSLAGRAELPEPDTQADNPLVPHAGEPLDVWLRRVADGTTPYDYGKPRELADAVQHWQGVQELAQPAKANGARMAAPADRADQVYRWLHGAREALCSAQTNLAVVSWRAMLGRAVRHIDYVGARECPEQWSRFDRTDEAEGDMLGERETAEALAQEAEPVWSLRHIYEVLATPVWNDDTRKAATMLLWHVETAEQPTHDPRLRP